MKKNPQKLKELDIEVGDERNIRIYEKSGYVAWQITSVLLFALFLLFVALDYGIARWLTLGVLIINSASFIISMVIHNKKI